MYKGKGVGTFPTKGGIELCSKCLEGKPWFALENKIMAVKIRLSRVGKVGNPLYRLIAIDEHKKRDGRAVEILGSYNPHSKENKLEINKARLDYWLSVGAKPTATVGSLLKKNS